MFRKLLQKFIKADPQQVEDSSAPSSAPPVPPFDIKLHHTLRGQTGKVTRIVWSPDRQLLASASEDRSIRLWDAESGRLFWAREVHSAAVISIAWSPDGRTIASGSYDQTVRLWDARTGQWQRTLRGHTDHIRSIAWSPDSRTIATGSGDNTVRLCDAATGALDDMLLKYQDPVGSVAWSPGGQLAWGSANIIRIWDMATKTLRWTLEGHFNLVLSMAWAPDGRTLASSSLDRVIHIWDTETGRLIWQIEKHLKTVTGISFSHDGRLLASKSIDDTVRIWRCDTWELVWTIPEPTTPSSIAAGLTFHPATSRLATLGDGDMSIRIWDLNIDVLLAAAPMIPSVHYTNAKVVLVGDSGVGKSGLGLVLSRQRFTPTESTHGRCVWIFERREVITDETHTETRETLLWDLAGQPGYRLIHQLQLNEVAVALLVFDAQRDTDPFAGVRYWDRALRQAQRLKGNTAPPLKKFLVAGRADRGLGVGRERTEALVRDLGFDGYFETSAKELWAIDKLAAAIQGAIDWQALPKVSSTRLFQDIKDFLTKTKQTGRLLSTIDDLYRTFLKSSEAPAATADLHEQFETCVGRIESGGLIRRLSFKQLVLLQPELLDAYAAALVNAAREQPDGLGTIAEADAQTGRFRMPASERIQDREQEQNLLIATVEDMLHYEIALREQVDTGVQLVFPSQMTREHPDLPDPTGKTVVFIFEGPVLNVYARLAVRLSYSTMFKKQGMWKNAATYTAIVGGACGIVLRELDEGSGELTLFFDKAASEETRFQFEEFVRLHIQRWAIPESIQRQRLFICPSCATPVLDVAIKRRRELGFDWIECNVCGQHVSLLDREQRLAPASNPPQLPKIERIVDARRELEVASSRLQGNIASGDVDIHIHIRELIETKRRRLQWLEQRHAFQGISTPPDVLMEIEDLRGEIADLEERHRTPNSDEQG